MIRVPGKFIYLCGPRTASRSTKWMLVDHCGGENLIGQHHASPQHLKRLAQFDEPACTTIRNPYPMLLSIYSRHGRLKPFEDWIRNWPPNQLVELGSGFDNTLFPYAKFSQHCYIFEYGLGDMLRRMGFPDAEQHVEQYQMGTNETPPNQLVGEDRDRAYALITKLYKDDIATYNHWKQINDRKK